MAFNAAVDPYFDFFGVVTVEGGGVDVEEAYIDTRQLPFGFQLRLGKFLSAFGRLNGMHKHFWDFYDTPLVYEGLIGGEGLKNPGLRCPGRRRSISSCRSTPRSIKASSMNRRPSTPSATS